MKPDGNNELLKRNWTRKIVCSQLADYFARHMMGLHLIVNHNGVPKYPLYTGILLYAVDRLLMMTAGHVIEEIDELSRDSKVTIEACGFINPMADDSTTYIPVAKEHLAFTGVDKDGFDFGLIIVRPGYAAPLMMNGGLEPVSKELWWRHESASPIGYYLIGFPNSHVKAKILDKRDRIVRGVTDAALVCLPLERIEDQGIAANDGLSTFWGHTNAFYGRILPDPDTGQFHIEDIRGMSGGAILSIEADSDGSLRYRMFGVQSSWLPTSRFIRATSIAPIDQLLEDMATRDRENRNGDEQDEDKG